MVSAIVTGAATGIGASVALRLASPGARLTLHTRRSIGPLETVAAQARSRGAEVELVLGDLAESGAGEKIVKAHEHRFAELDAVIAVAGFPLRSRFEEMTPADISYAFQGNSQSFFELTQAAYPMLKNSQRGRIVAVGSFTAHVFRTDLPQFPASAASKGAVEVAVRTLALGMASHGITVNCVVPGFIERDAAHTDNPSDEAIAEIARRIPLGRRGTPEDVAGAIAFLLGPDAAYITGQSIHVNGGLC
ncbi:SDR family NAD(P)-dependent oxidoreductase [Oricola sp.]|uniref:SDR family NAD(P)-dependent oxidoreductase n=1 Tax=Oricola sp. TaxID=1979950 RepID=UPI00320BEA3A|nr:SDR family oxidoreductase [Oricola sp.]